MNSAPLIVMYHYILPDPQPAPGGIRPLLASEFESQIDWLSERYEIVCAEKFLRDYKSGRPICLLTFDDGTKDHATIAAPILARRNLSGVFFVLSGPARGIMPLTHAIHWLLRRNELDVWQAFEDYAIENLGGIELLGSAQDAAKIYHYESPLRARIKYAANMAQPPAHTQKIIDRFLRAAGETASALGNEWFASSEQIKNMHDLGMTIGMHGVSHQSLQTLGATGIEREIDQCADYLTQLLDQPPQWWACPFGGSNASGGAVEAMHVALRRNKIRAAVSTASRTVRADDSPLSLPRIDAANLPPRIMNIELK